mmetsp:Transcript_3681/g.16907  ORF Transcript_3681/g.16907 Transcript_3681/m.16907 type:complete len:251 (+) Transcript_3681:2954-3706(+)
MGIRATASPTFTTDDDSSPPDDGDSSPVTVTSPRPSPGLPITFDTFTPFATTPPLSNTHANSVSYRSVSSVSSLSRTSSVAEDDEEEEAVEAFNLEIRFSSLAFLSPASIATIHGTSLTLTKDASSSSTAAHSRRFVDRPPAEATAPAAMESPQSLARRILSTSATDDDDSCAFPRTRDRAACGSSALVSSSSSFESTSMPPRTSRLPHVCERRAASSSSSSDDDALDSELIDDDVSASTSISAGLGVGA